MQSWEDASSLVFLIFGLNHPADEEMFVASSGNEKHKHLLDSVQQWESMWESGGDNGAIVAFYTHGFQPNVTQLSHSLCTVCERLHILLILCMLIYNFNITEQVKAIWFQECEVHMCLSEYI